MIPEISLSGALRAMCSGGMKVPGEGWGASPRLGVIGLAVGQSCGWLRIF